MVEAKNEGLGGLGKVMVHTSPLLFAPFPKKCKRRRSATAVVMITSRAGGQAKSKHIKA